MKSESRPHNHYQQLNFFECLSHDVNREQAEILRDHDIRWFMFVSITCFCSKILRIQCRSCAQWPNFSRRYQLESLKRWMSFSLSLFLLCPHFSSLVKQSTGAFTFTTLFLFLINLSALHYHFLFHFALSVVRLPSPRLHPDPFLSTSLPFYRFYFCVASASTLLVLLLSLFSLPSSFVTFSCACLVPAVIEVFFFFNNPWFLYPHTTPLFPPCLSPFFLTSFDV